MTSRTHDAFAFASLITMATLFPPAHVNALTAVTAILAADIGGLFPDLDQAGNKLWDSLPAGNFMGSILRRLFYKHRTLSHSLIGLYIVYQLLTWLLPKFLNPEFIDPKIIIASFLIGYISHLFADSLTEDGVPLFFPINLNIGIPPIKKIRLKTGLWFEKIVVYPAVWVYLVWFIYTHQTAAINLLHSIS